MNLLITAGVDGLAIGAIYALVSFGYALVFKASHTINLASGSLLLIGGYLAFEIGAGNLGAPFLVAAIGGVLGVACLGWAAYRLIGRPLSGASPDSLVVATIGLDMAVRALMSAEHTWSHNSLDVGAPWMSAVSIAGHSVAQSDLWIIAISLVVLLLLGLMVERTAFGLTMRACAEDHEAASAQGISTHRNLAVAWVLAAALAALAGILVGAFPRTLDVSNYSWALRALPAVVIGGMDSLRGAVVGGVLVGLVEAFSSAYQPAWLGVGYQLVLPYAVMLVVLLLRPQGLFGSKDVVRV